MVKKYLDKLSPRQRLVAGIAAVVVGSATLFGGCKYVSNKIAESGSLDEPKETIAMVIDNKLVDWDPGSYIDVATYYFLQNPEAASQYAENLMNLVVLVNDADVLNDETDAYLFSSNASRVSVETGISVCEENVFSRADGEQNLAHILRGIGQLEAGDYGKVIYQVLQEWWPW